MEFCFYHSADYDGILSGFLVKHFIPAVQLKPINYGDKFPFEEITKDDIVYMVDFSLQPFDDMLKLLQSCKRLIWIDHHISALKALAEHPDTHNPDFAIEGIRNIKFAGCELTWRYFSSDPLPATVYLIGRYDVWDDSSIWERILAFQYGMKMLNLKADDYKWYAYLPLNNIIENDKNQNIENIIKDGRVCLTYIQSDNHKYLQTYGYEIEFEGLKAIVCNKGLSNSKLFDSVWDASKYDIMITFCKLQNHPTKWTVSLYSTNPKVDCSILAKQRGGGGHKGAAGFLTEDISGLLPKSGEGK